MFGLFSLGSVLLAHADMVKIGAWCKKTADLILILLVGSLFVRHVNGTDLVVAHAEFRAHAACLRV